MTLSREYSRFLIRTRLANMRVNLPVRSSRRLQAARWFKPRTAPASGAPPRPAGCPRQFDGPENVLFAHARTAPEDSTPDQL